MAFGSNPLAALLASRSGAGQPQPAQGGNPSELINQASELLQRALASEKDPVEKEGISKIIALLHGFSAREQKQRDAAMGAGPAVQMLRRSQG